MFHSYYLEVSGVSLKVRYRKTLSARYLSIYFYFFKLSTEVFEILSMSYDSTEILFETVVNPKDDRKINMR